MASRKLSAARPGLAQSFQHVAVEEPVRLRSKAPVPRPRSPPPPLPPEAPEARQDAQAGTGGGSTRQGDPVVGAASALAHTVPSELPQLPAPLFSHLDWESDEESWLEYGGDITASWADQGASIRSVDGRSAGAAGIGRTDHLTGMTGFAGSLNCRHASAPSHHSPCRQPWQPGRPVWCGRPHRVRCPGARPGSSPVAAAWRLWRPRRQTRSRQAMHGRELQTATRCTSSATLQPPAAPARPSPACQPSKRCAMRWHARRSRRVLRQC